MKKKIVISLTVLALICLSIGLCCCGKKEDPVSEEVVQSSEESVPEEVVQVPVDDGCIDLLEKMKIVKETEAFDEELLGNPCDKFQAYEMLNTMKGQDGAEVPASYQGQQMSQQELLSLYLKDLFGIEVKEVAGENFEAYAGELEITDYFSSKEAEATNNNLISLAHACVHYGLDDWENTKTVFQQMLESGFFNGMDISTFKVAAMDDIFNYGTNKCPATEVYDESTGRTYYFVDYFGNSYNSSSSKNSIAIGTTRTKKELLLRPYFSMQNMTADGTGIVFTRFPGGLTYLYNVETQTMKYIDSIYCEGTGASYMYMTPSDTLYYIKEVDGIFVVYRKDLKSDSEPEKIVDTEGAYYIHVTNDEKYASIYSSSKYKGDGGETGFVRIDIENKKLEVVAYQSIPATYRLPGDNNIVNHVKINPVYPELYFFAHDFKDGKYFRNVIDRANIKNVDTGEVTTIFTGEWPNESMNNLPTSAICFTHESWSENGEYLYITNMAGSVENIPSRGMVRVNKDSTHRLNITNPQLDEVWRDSGKILASSHASASGDDKYCALHGYYLTIISQETNQVFPIADLSVPESHKSHVLSGHPYHAHPTVSRGDTYLVNWGQYYVPADKMDIPDSGSLGVAYFDFTDIDENELAKGGEVEYNEFVSRLSYEGLDCESEAGTFFEKEAIHAKAGNFATFNIDTSIVDSINDTVTISFDYYDNGAKDLKLIYTKAVEDAYDYNYSENGSADIACTNTGTWKRAEIVVHGDFETSGKYGNDFKIGSETSDVYITNIEVKK